VASNHILRKLKDFHNFQTKQKIQSSEIEKISIAVFGLFQDIMQILSNKNLEKNTVMKLSKLIKYIIYQFGTNFCTSRLVFILFFPQNFSKFEHFGIKTLTIHQNLNFVNFFKISRMVDPLIKKGSRTPFYIKILNIF